MKRKVFTMTETTKREQNCEQKSNVRKIRLNLIDPFPNHPFYIFDDEDMYELVEIRRYNQTTMCFAKNARCVCCVARAHHTIVCFRPRALHPSTGGFPQNLRPQPRRIFSRTRRQTEGGLSPGKVDNAVIGEIRPSAAHCSLIASSNQ